MYSLSEKPVSAEERRRRERQEKFLDDWGWPIFFVIVIAANTAFYWSLVGIGMGLTMIYEQLPFEYQIFVDRYITHEFLR